MNRLVLFIILLTFSSFTKPDLKKTKIFEGVTVGLPKDLLPMTEQDLAAKSASVRKPLAAYTSMDRQADFVVNYSYSKWAETDMDMLKGFYRGSIQNLFDKVEFLSEGIEEINRRKYVYFEFLSTLEGDPNSISNQKVIRKYTYVQYVLVNGKTLVFNFTCPANQRNQWQEVAKEMMQTIEIKKTL